MSRLSRVTKTKDQETIARRSVEEGEPRSSLPLRERLGLAATPNVVPPVGRGLRALPRRGESNVGGIGDTLGRGILATRCTNVTPGGDAVQNSSRALQYISDEESNNDTATDEDSEKECEIFPESQDDSTDSSDYGDVSPATQPAAPSS
jgi:hypothetical protein